MIRRKFLFTTLSILPLPLLSKMKINLFIGANKGFKVNSGEGRIHGHLKLRGVNANIIDVKVSGNDTDGALAIFEQTSLSKGRGTPLHLHNSQEEIFYVIEGSYYFQLGDEKFNLTKGESIFLPRKVPHAWTQVSERGKMTMVLQPAGKLEDFFVTMAALDHDPDQKEIAKIFSDNDMQVVGAPLSID